MMVIPRQQKPLVIAVLAALLLHVFFFLVFVLLVHTGYFGVTPQPEKPPTTLTFVEPPAPPPEQVAMPEQSGESAPPVFHDSTAEPEAAPPEEPAPFISDRNTTASAENPDAAGNLPVPSQEGLDIPGIELTQEQYTDGPGIRPAINSLPQPPEMQALAALEQAQPSPKREPAEPQDSSEEATVPTDDPQPVKPEEIEPMENPDQPLDEAPENPQPTEEALQPETPPEVVEQPQETQDLEFEPALDPDLLALLEARSPEQPQSPEPLPAPREQPEDNQADPEQPTPPQPTVEELLEAQRRRAAPLSQSGFRRERALTQLEGSITNRGNNNVGSEQTPLGSYYKQVSEAVSRVWHEKTSRNFDLFRIGTVKIRFRVSPSGKVSGMTVTENTGNEIFANITMEAIQQSPIPEMPADVRELTLGEPLTIEYTFVMY